MLSVNCVSLVAEVKCPAYQTFPTGVEGGSSDPCKPAASFQLSSTTDPSCSLKCKAGYEQKGGSGASTLQCSKDGKLTGALSCTGKGSFYRRFHHLIIEPTLTLTRDIIAKEAATTKPPGTLAFHQLFL